MDGKETRDQNAYSVEFLLAEYQRLMESFWHTEELGERRVNFFVTLTAAVIAALAATRDQGISLSQGRVDPIFFYGLGALLLFGLVTLVRIIRRNLESHRYLRATGRIRRYFTETDQGIGSHLYFEPRDDRPVRKKEWREIAFLGTGGLVETIALVNCLIAAALWGLATIRSQWGGIWIWALVGFILAWVVQFLYVKWRYERGRPADEEIKFRGV
ncbi:MAG: hypothetical protein JRJ26_04155 [Deltaproteobacteria bacterium]|nr:hypothetical protein [Deltaproteobacteria bacterium]